jgi:hypothetical protein
MRMDGKVDEVPIAALRLKRARAGHLPFLVRAHQDFELAENRA